MTKAPKFHWLTIGRDRAKCQPKHDVILYETEHFAVLPSLGSFVKNWMLIIPKRPMPSLAHLEKEGVLELIEVSKYASKALKLNPSKSFVFEHGGEYGSEISCGVDQAHLHLLELSFDLVQEAIQFEPELKWQYVPNGFIGLKKFVGNREYLAVGDFSNLLVCFPEKAISQWFRKLIASKIGRPDIWDYQSNPFYSEIANTNRRFAVNWKKKNQI